MRIIVLPVGRCRLLEENESGLRFRRNKIWRFKECTTPYNRPSLEAIWFEFSMKGASNTVKNLCLLWLASLKSVWYSVGRHTLAAIQLAVNCGKLYFARCCALKRTGTFASEIYFNWGCFEVSFLTSISVSTAILRLGKAEYFKFCAWFSLVHLPTEAAWVFLEISESFSKGNCFAVFLPAFRTCLMSRQDFFVPYCLPSQVKYYLDSHNVPPF